MTGRKECMMSIQDTILVQIQYANELAEQMKDVTVFDPTEEYIGLYWCGRQALDTTRALTESLTDSAVLPARQGRMFSLMIDRTEEKLILQRTRFDVYREVLE